jgi:integrase
MPPLLAASEQDVIALEPARHPVAGGSFPPRTTPASWPATQVTREQALARVDAMPLVSDPEEGRTRRLLGMRLLLDWLAAQPGDSWQQRWAASGAPEAGAAWRMVPAAWLAEQGHGPWRRQTLIEVVPAAIAADLLRPGLPWLVEGALARGGLLVRNMSASRDAAGFTRLRALCQQDGRVSTPTTTQVAYRGAVLLAAKGGTLEQITVGDVLELFAIEDQIMVSPSPGRPTFYRLLAHIGALGDNPPASLRGLRTHGQRTPEELIDRYGITCRPIRDLLVDYLRERAPALDYTSLDALSYYLGRQFWADLEAHHPGIDSLRLPREVADAWKKRLSTITKSNTDSHGAKTSVTVARINYRECLTPVRAFYLDLAHWAVEAPERWAVWVAPCPVGDEEVNRRKDKRHRKSRMDARTRELLPALPALVRAVDSHRNAAASLLAAARAASPDQLFTEAGISLVRSAVARGAADIIWAHDPATGVRRNLTREEDHAFWTWAAVEVLRATGIRVEELLELNHHSLVQYRLPTTGELVPLLQILPSKTDAERLVVVSPDLADVLSTVITRTRQRSGAVPMVVAYDARERLWLPPAPALFQHRIGTEDRAFAAGAINTLLTRAVARAGLTDPVDGEALNYTPHDFRRMFITDAILGGLPPHIAQVIAGHRDINVTLGYKAIYPDEAIQAHLAYIARRRALRPSEEYRTPTDEEWQQFLGHFERRKVSTGTCARAFGTACIHEHACIRCSMLWPDPDQRPRLVQIRDNLIDRIAEAEREGWLGEIEGLHVSLAGANDKIEQIDQQRQRTQPVRLSLPTTRQP